MENGIHLIRMEQDAAEGIMMIRKSNQQQYGTVHGGVLVAFADTIAGHSLAPHGRMCVTQGSTVNFLRRRRGPTSSAGPPPCRWAAGSAWSLWSSAMTGTS